MFRESFRARVNDTLENHSWKDKDPTGKKAADDSKQESHKHQGRAKKTL